MFWGLVLEPSKRYTQKVQQSFHISQAALELSSTDLQPVQLILEYDGVNYVLATLSKNQSLYQVPLDLNFNTGDQISFRTIGKGRVHLTGYHLLEDDLEDALMTGEEESDVEEEEEVEDSFAKSDNSLTTKQVKRKKAESSKSPNNKKNKLSVKNETQSDDASEDDDELDEEDSDLTDNYDDDEEGGGSDDLGEEEDDDDDDDDIMELDDEDDMDSEEDESEEDEGKKVQKKVPSSTSKNKAEMNGKTPKNKKMNESQQQKGSPKGTPKSEKKKGNQSPGKEVKENKTPKSEKKGGGGDQNKTQEPVQKKVIEGGVIVEELRMGDGAVAKPGRMAQVYYVGRLQSNKKQFDATTQGPGFKFRLGKGEVIKGWDIGINGMKVGGKRRITIPSQLAYGAKGSPPAIPPNSSLVFEVELRGVN